MLKGAIIWIYVLAILNFTAASSNFKAKDLINGSQFVLKSLAEYRQQDHLYKPLRIYTHIIEKSFSTDEANKNFLSVLVTSANIISDLVLTKPITGMLRLGENDQCSDILLGQIIQSGDLSADIAIFAVNNEENEEILASMKCEVNEDKTIRSIAVEINAKKFMKLDKLLQVKELCSAISRALYEDEELERQVLLGEIGEFLLNTCNDPNASFSTASNKCVCNKGYILTSEVCLPCKAPCATCSIESTSCTSCEDPSHMKLSDWHCSCLDPNMTFSTTTNMCVYKTDYYLNSGVYLACSAPCATCLATDVTTCLSCDDSTHMTLSEGVCTCNDPNASFNTTTNKCVCNKGYSLRSGVCFACKAPCATCSIESTSCTSCEDPNHMKLSDFRCRCIDSNMTFSTATNMCVCKTGYYSDPGVCLPCAAPCNTCFAEDLTTCLSCDDSTHMTLSEGVCTCNDPNASFSTASNKCVCNKGYSLRSGICFACKAPCATCSIESTSCTSCEDPSHMKLSDFRCRCIDLNATFSTTTNMCVCKTGYYLNSGVCLACAAPCATCFAAADICLSCDDSTHMTLSEGACTCNDPNASFSTASNKCVCNKGYSLKSGVCTACTASCD